MRKVFNTTDALSDYERRRMTLDPHFFLTALFCIRVILLCNVSRPILTSASSGYPVAMTSSTTPLQSHGLRADNSIPKAPKKGSSMKEASGIYLGSELY